MEALATVKVNVNEDKDSDEFGDEGDLNTSLELVASDLEVVSYEIKTLIDSQDGVDKVNVSAAINKIRQIPRLFRKTPLKNKILQNYVSKGTWEIIDANSRFKNKMG